MAFWNRKKSPMSGDHLNDERGDRGPGLHGPSPLDQSQSSDQTDPASPDGDDAQDDQLAALKAALDEATSARLRLLADYQNFQRRSMNNERLQFSEGVARAMGGVVNVIDHFDMALQQDPATATVQQIMEGVKVIRDELIKAAASNGVTMIRPAHNDPFVPGQHEAVMQQPAEGVLSGHINMVFQPGYVLNTATGERVLRPAKVSVG